MDEENNKPSIKTFFMSWEAYNDVSEGNRRLAQRYIEAVKNDARVTSQHTIDYNARIMGFLLKNIKTDLDKLTIDDIDDINSAIKNMTRQDRKNMTLQDGTAAADSTKQQYRIGVKRFIHWMIERYNPTGYEKFIKAIKNSRGSAPHKDAEELFTIAEIDKMIAAATELRDKAMIATLAESGCRAGELLSCRIKNVIFTTTGCKLTFPEGKTGKRTVDLVFASPYIDHYLRQHPSRENPDAPLWVTRYHSEHSALTYSGLDVIVKRIGRTAGIKKRVHLHNFRHTAATQVAKMWTEPIMKQFFGWKPNSNMPSIYISLSGDDMEAAVLADRYGIVERKQISKDLEVGKCPKCWKTVSATATFCYNCGAPLTKEAKSSVDATADKILAYFTEHPEMLTTIVKQQ